MKQLPQPCLHLHLQSPEPVSCVVLLSLPAVQLQPYLLLFLLSKPLSEHVQLSSHALFFGFNHLAFSTLSGRKKGMVGCCCRSVRLPEALGFDLGFGDHIGCAQ